MLTDVWPLAFKASGGMLSAPAALPFLRFFNTVLISCMDIGLVLMLSGCAACTGGGSTGGGRFSTVLKWFLHSLSWSSSLVSMAPLQFRIGHSVLSVMSKLDSMKEPRH